MRTLRRTLAACAMIAGVGGILGCQRTDLPMPSRPSSMRIESPAYAENASIPARYTCDGENVSPPLRISGVPADAESLAVVLEDPDAPLGTWIHWTLWNIDPAIRDIAEGTAPPGAVEGVTSSGEAGYGGPCPPSGTHRYVFHLFALDTRLELPAAAKAKQLMVATEGHVLARAKLVGLYARP